MLHCPAPSEKSNTQNRSSGKSMVDVIIIGAGPYGLSLAAYLKGRGLTYRIFGQPMYTWQTHMPKGMRLKSEGFASSLYDPGSTFTDRKSTRLNSSHLGISYAVF